MDFLESAHALLDTPAPSIALAISKIKFGMVVDRNAECAGFSGADRGFALLSYIQSALADLDVLVPSDLPRNLFVDEMLAHISRLAAAGEDDEPGAMEVLAATMVVGGVQ